MKKLFNQTIASTLIGLIGTNTLAWVPRAYANEPRSASPTYTISFDLPDHGDIDRYHPATMALDKTANALYLLRNTAVEDLLNTRRSLKILLGGTARMRQVSDKNDLGFEVPGGIIDLYLLGQLGADRGSQLSQATIGDAVSAPSQDQGATHVVEEESVPEIAHAIHWLSGHDPGYDESLRLRVLMGLAYVTSQIVKIDQSLKFVQEDFWVDKTMAADFHKDFVGPEMELEAVSSAANGVMVGLGSNTYERLKLEWLQSHQMLNVINVLAGHREYLLDRYHLLGIEVEGKPLYKLIYNAMEAQGFPIAETVQTAADAHLPSGNTPMRLPDTFEKAVDAANDFMADPSRKAGILSELYKAANGKIDLALIESLKANSDRLAALSKDIDYKGDSTSPLSSTSPLIELAKYDDLWSATIAKYGYLAGFVDLVKTHDEMRAFWDQRDKNGRHLRYTAYGVGIGIGIAAIVFSGGTAAEGAPIVAEGAEATATTLSALGIPLRSWLIGAGMIADAGLSVGTYVDSAEASKVAKGLYLGTVHQGGNNEVKTTTEMKDSDFHLMLGSLVMLGLSSANVMRLAVSRALIMRESVTFVELGEEDLVALRKAVAEISKRAEELAPMGKALLSTVEKLLGMTVRENKLMELGQAVEALAKELRVPPSTIFSRLENAKGVGSLIKGWRARQLSSRIMIASNILKQLAGNSEATVGTTFNANLVNQQINNFVVSVVSERMARGDKMLHEERSEFIGDMVRGTLITAVLAWTGARSDTLSAAEEVVSQAGPRLSVVDGFSGTFWSKFAEEARAVGKAGATNATVGMIINGSSDAVSQTIQFAHDRDNPNAPSVKDRVWHVARGTAWNGLSLGISSTLRYRYFLKWAEKNIAQAVADGPGRTILIQSAITLNNLVGGWTYVSFGKKLKFLDSAGNAVPDDDSGPAPETADIAKLEVGDTTGAYFKVSGGATSADYMFDFLRGGDKLAGPAPVLQ